MSKAILIINTPKSCYGCDLTYEDSCGMYCSCTKEDVGNYVTGRSKRCPLKPMPEKRSTEYIPTRNPYITDGYNACIDEILNS